MRSVQPHIHALNKMAGHIVVVVFHKDYTLSVLWVAADLRHSLQNAFSLVISGVGLTGKNNLDRSVGVSHQPCEAFRLRQDQVSPFIRRKAPGRTYCKHMWIQSFLKFRNAFAFTSPLRLQDKTPAHEANESHIQVLLGFP